MTEKEENIEDCFPQLSKHPSKIKCVYCTKDITSAARMKSAVCKDVTLCLQCFSSGVEMNSLGHLKTHPYRVMDNLSFPLVEKGWSVVDELRLIRALEMYGIGNWRCSTHPLA